MKSNQVKTISVFLAIAVIIFGCIVVMRDPAFMDSQEIRYPSDLLGGYSDTGYYQINPETILNSLDQGDTDIFLPMITNPDARIYSTPFPWKQSDYLKIAGALHHFVWKETTDDWSIHSISFDGDCRYDPIGFDIVNITYYKATGIQKYNAHVIEIYPLSEEVAWGGGANYPRSLFGGWNNIDLKRIKVTAEEALELAEENGGKLARLRVENVCRIHLLLSRSGWLVYYSNKSTYSIFEMMIDPSGKYEILNTNP